MISQDKLYEILNDIVSKIKSSDKELDYDKISEYTLDYTNSQVIIKFPLKRNNTKINSNLDIRTNNIDEFIKNVRENQRSSYIGSTINGEGTLFYFCPAKDTLGYWRDPMIYTISSKTNNSITLNITGNTTNNEISDFIELYS